MFGLVLLLREGRKEQQPFSSLYMPAQTILPSAASLVLSYHSIGLGYRQLKPQFIHQSDMPLLVSSSTNNVSTGAASPVPVPAAAAAEHSDGLLFDGLVLGHGDDVNNKAKADNDDDDAPTEKLEWLRSQIIGSEAEFASPFGTRRITYADHTASGRCLRFVEEFVARNVLPFYGEQLNTTRCLIIRMWTAAISLAGAQETHTRRTATWACTRASWPATRRGT
jgi:hypothetical protein